jgi:hypothetical protein
MSTLESLPIEVQLDILEELYVDNFFAHDDQTYQHLTRPIDYYWSEDSDEDEEIEADANPEGDEQYQEVLTGNDGSIDDNDSQVPDQSGQTQDLEPNWDVMPKDDDLDIAWNISRINSNGIHDPSVAGEESSSGIKENKPPWSRSAYPGMAGDDDVDDDIVSSERNKDDGSNIVVDVANYALKTIGL